MLPSKSPLHAQFAPPPTTVAPQEPRGERSPSTWARNGDETGADGDWQRCRGGGTPKQGPLTPPGHSPDVLLGVVGASNQAGDQVCKAGTPQGEGPPPSPQHPPPPRGTRGAVMDGPSVPEAIGPTPAALPAIGVPADLGVQGAVGGPSWLGGLGFCHIVPPARENVGFQGTRGDGSPPWGQPGAPSTPGHATPMGQDTAWRGCIPGGCPPTWVLRGGVGQEEASSRAVAGAVEQDGHGAGVCHQEWGGRGRVPAVGPCRQGRGRGEDLGSLGTGTGTQTPGCHCPRQGQWGSGIWAVLRVAPAPSQPTLSPLPPASLPHTVPPQPQAAPGGTCSPKHGGQSWTRLPGGHPGTSPPP